MNNKFKFEKKNFLKKLTIVSGTHFSGKGMVVPIVSSLKSNEHFQKLYIINQIMILINFRKIEKKSGIFLIKHILDTNYYEQLIGRNTNFRFEDETSIFKSCKINEILSRMYESRGVGILKKHHKKNSTLVLDLPDALIFYDLWKLAFSKIKLINIFRNPIDLASSWFINGLHSLENAKLNQIPLLKEKKTIAPFYFYKDLKKYNSTNKIDRVISMVISCLNDEYKKFKLLKNNKNVLFLDFDDFSINTNNNLNKICKFLKIKPSKFTKKIMQNERVPRKFDKNLRIKKKMYISKLSSRAKFDELMKMVEKYNRIKKKIL